MQQLHAPHLWLHHCVSNKQCTCFTPSSDEVSAFTLKWVHRAMRAQCDVTYMSMSRHDPQVFLKAALSPACGCVYCMQRCSCIAMLQLLWRMHGWKA